MYAKIKHNATFRRLCINTDDALSEAIWTMSQLSIFKSLLIRGKYTKSCHIVIELVLCPSGLPATGKIICWFTVEALLSQRLWPCS